MKIRRGVKLVTACLACAVLAIVGRAYGASATSGQTEPVIADGVFIGQVDVSGMTSQEAETAVENYVDSLKDSELVLSFNGQESRVSFSELGFSWDNPDVVDEAVALGNSGNILERYKALSNLKNESVVLELAYSWDDDALESYLQEQADEMETEAVEATITRTSSASNPFETTESQDGLTVDIASTVKAIKEAVAGEWNGGDLEVDAVVEVLEPRLTTEIVESIHDLLGEHSTRYNAAETDRSQNLINGTGFINGVVMLPGEEMSLHDYLYPCTVENGYRSAIAYADGGYVDSIGGGICQISTTVYNAVLKAEFEVISRYPHSMTVSYADPGLDSAEAESSGKDLRFANNTDYPVYVEAWARGGQLYIAFWGTETRPDNREVEYYSEYTETYLYRGQVQTTYDPNLPYGTVTGVQGEYPQVKATAYKRVIVDGEVVSDEAMYTDTYRASIAKQTIGTGGLTEEEYLAGVQPTTETQPQDQGQQQQPQQPVTQPSTEATQPSTEATEPSTEATQPSAGATEPSSEATQPSEAPVEPPTESQPSGEGGASAGTGAAE